MLNDILAIIMVSFGLFAISMFVLLYVYLKRHYNYKHIDDNYMRDLDRQNLLEDDDSSDDVVISKKKK